MDSERIKKPNRRLRGTIAIRFGETICPRDVPEHTACLPESARNALLLIIIVLSGCTTLPPHYQSRAAITPRVIPATVLSCQIDDGTRCALPSPIAVLSERAFKTESHFAVLLDVGREALILRLHLIRSAKHSIDLQTFIWANDESGRLIMRELVAAAKRGVTIRMISDQLREVSPEYLARLALTHENLSKRIYNPFLGNAVMADTDYVWGTFFHFGVLNHRMHCKLIVVDERIAIVGGRNVQNRYFDLDPAFDFIDRDLMVTGPVVGAMRRSFDEYWNSPIVAPLDQLADVREHLFTPSGQQASLSPIDDDYEKVYERIVAAAGDNAYIRSVFVENAFGIEQIAFTADPPMKPFVKQRSAGRDTSAVLRQVVGEVQRELLVQTPYPILSKSAYRMLRNIRKRKPEIDFTVSTNSLASADHAFVYALAFKRKKRNVKELGFNIFELRDAPGDSETFVPDINQLRAQRAHGLNDDGGFATIRDGLPGLLPTAANGPRISIHAKSIVVDGRVAIIGSHNFDPRSRDINTENAVIIWNDEFARALANRIRLATEPQNSWLIARSEEVPVIGYFSDAIGTISRLLPIFDVWPFRWTSSFELKDGMTPVPRGHPDFYHRYKDVGQFPNMGLDIEQLEVHLISAFGAVAEPFM